METDGFARTYHVHLLCENEPIIHKPALLERLRARIGEVDTGGDGLNFSFPEHTTEFQEGPAPSLAMVIITELNQNKDVRNEDLAQSWFWRDAVDIVSRCRYMVGIADLMAGGLPYKTRLALIHNIVMSVLDIVDCDAIHWIHSQQNEDPDTNDHTKDTNDPDPHKPTNKVRFFNITDRQPGEMIMD